MQSVFRVGLITLLWLAALPLAASAQDGDTDAVAAAQAFLDQLLAGEFEAAAAQFSPQVGAALPVEQLAQIWQSLPLQVGAYELALEPQTQAAAGMTTVVIPLQFAFAVVDLQVTVDTDGRIGGLYFRPSATPRQVTYEPPAYVDTSSFVEEEITLNAGTGWELPGTLTLPIGDGPFPAVVLVHGSGPNDRDETLGPNKPFRDLAWGLASQGIAVLRYDKRTLVHGQRVAGLEDFTVQDETVDDAVAAVELLRARPEIQPDSVFVLGHSLGGYLAPQIGTLDAAIAGLIVLAGSARPLTTLVWEQYHYLAALDGEVSEEEQAALAEIEAALAATAHVQPGDDPSGLLFGVAPAYWLDLQAYDAVARAAALITPLLILQGERDYQVTMTDFDLWQQGLDARDDVTFISYPALNHAFIAGEGVLTPDEYQQPGHVDETVVNDIASWILAHTR